MEYQPLKCFKCSRFTIQDEGYSEYTLTGRNYNCQAKQFPDLDKEPSEDLADVIDRCEFFNQGQPLELGVNGKPK